MARAGEVLTDDEVREFAAYHNAQIAPPEKFDTVVQDGTDARGTVYRYATAEELKAAKEVTARNEVAADADAKLMERIRGEAQKRGIELPPPPEPPEAATPLGSEKRG